ncbi:thioredoxin-related transmembrane protein 4 [Discoglossus pictus]
MEGCRRRTSEDLQHSHPSHARPVWLTSPVTICLAIVTVLAGVPGHCRAQEAPTNTVRAVRSSNWTLVLQGEWMVKFYAPWCPACQQIQSEWESFAKRSQALDVHVGKVDVTEEPGLSGRFFVTTLPTIFHAKDGVFRKYHGSRMVDDLQTYIMEKKWEVVEPIAGWKSPSSILMSGMAGLFHLSGWIRQMHNYFTGPLGIPTWGSYIVFILATLLIGLVLGLILVLLADCFCPSKTQYKVVRTEAYEEDEVLGEDPETMSEEKKDLSDKDTDDEENDEAMESEEDSAVEDTSGDEEEREKLQEEQDSITQEDKDNLSPEEKPSTPETESALRQRRTEPTVDNGH